jgi:ATP-dependent Clp protease ATP-binding subunit ClpA
LLDNAKLAVQAGLRRAKGGILLVPHIARFFGGFRADFPEAAGNELQKAFFASDGEPVIIGTATETEYTERLEKNAAVLAHAHTLRVEATTVAETAAVLDMLKPRFEADYGLVIAGDSLPQAARLAGRYLTTTPLPASAVHLLHRACVTVKMSTHSGLTVKPSIQPDQTLDAEDVMVTVSQMTGVPVNRLGAEERARYAHMVEHLRQRIIGQDEAVLAVSRAVKTARVGLKDPKRPIGSFFFLGPTGVGKTELAKALAEFLFSTEDSMIVLDMTEYQEENAVNRLIGAPPGYVGYEAGGQLTDKVALMPYSVVLFDEVEKAHPDVFNALLQVLDDGRITDGQGRTVDFRNTVLIMTSNIGSQAIQEVSNAEQREAMVREALKQFFRPEFLNRIDEVIIFDRLDARDLDAIVKIQIQRVVDRMRKQNITLKLSDDAVRKVADEGYDPVFGARPLKRAIQKLILDPLSLEMLDGKFKDGDVVEGRMEKGSVVFSKA